MTDVDELERDGNVEELAHQLRWALARIKELEQGIARFSYDSSRVAVVPAALREADDE